MSTSFVPGDLVQLVSGGPKMTVRGPGEDTPGFVGCLYFDGSKLVIAEVPPAAIVKVAT